MTTQEIKNFIGLYLSKHFSSAEVKAFLFGSSLRQDRFFDVDVGLTGQLDPAQIALLKLDLEESSFPYKVDIVNFDEVRPEFKEHVFKDKVLWLDF